MLKLTKIVLLIPFLALTAGTQKSPETFPGAMNRFEITKDDIFAKKKWDSTQITIIGFYLGMTRADASAEAHNHQLKLFVPDLREMSTCTGNRCAVCYPTGICPGITLTFDNADNIARIEIDSIPEGTGAAVQKLAITKQFSGQTYKLMNEYSSKLRLNLLGPGVVLRRTKPTLTSPLTDFVYGYKQRGVEVYLQLDDRTPDSPVSLTVSFLLPG